MLAVQIPQCSFQNDQTLRLSFLPSAQRSQQPTPMQFQDYLHRVSTQVQHTPFIAPERSNRVAPETIAGPRSTTFARVQPSANRTRPSSLPAPTAASVCAWSQSL